MSYILKIATAVPDYCYPQETLMSIYRNSTDDESARRKIKILAAAEERENEIVGEIEISAILQ